MAKLSAVDRAKLPDTAFAYVDSRGQRRLPINDVSHVRNALSRFRQVHFESDAARDTARRRLLSAAKRHGIVPIGFIHGELRSAHAKSTAGRLVIELGRIDTSVELESELRRTLGDPDLTILTWAKSQGTYVDCVGEPAPLPREGSGRSATFVQGRGRSLMAIVHEQDALRTPEIAEAVLAAVHLVSGRELLEKVDEMGVATTGLPDGEVTFLLTDIEGSTPLLNSLGDRFAEVLAEVRHIISTAVLENGGRQVEARADEFVAVFESAVDAVLAGVALQRGMAAQDWPHGHPVRVRAGVHTGEILLTETGYVGMTVHVAARIMSAAHGGQVVVSGDTADEAGPVEAVAFTDIGTHTLRGVPDPHRLLQIEADGLPADFPRPAV